jgi:hypothetical protein
MRKDLTSIAVALQGKLAQLLPVDMQNTQV